VGLFGEVNARALALAGAEPGMMLHNSYGYGLFTGGLGFHQGAERLGLTVVPVSGGMTERQLLLIADFKPDVIACTPSYALTLAHEFRSRGVSPDEISLQAAVLGAEPWTETMRAAIDEGLGVRSCNVYGLSEVIGPGVSAECLEERAGSHVSEDHFLPEVVDADSGEPLPDGAEGVLVLTTLTKQALPLVRYWTGDLTSLGSEPCSCGRTLVRMGPIRGRTDDMLIIRGVNVFPTQVEEIVLEDPALSGHFFLEVTRPRTLDELRIVVEARPASGELEREESSRVLAGKVKSRIGVSVDVEVRGEGGVERSLGKARRVYDRRQP
jgi:phenylacetate-CoA ligase